jgi:tetratricopeptide (TPR) repeat protein
LHALALTPAGSAPVTPTPQPAESLDDLLSQGKALIAQKKYAEAIPYLERATQRDPRSFDAWANLGYMYIETGRPADGLAANDRALALDDKQAWVWNNKGFALRALTRHEEALACYDRALALDPNYRDAWYNKGISLNDLNRSEEALVALDRALALDPNFAFAWNNKGLALYALNRSEALACYDRALAVETRTIATPGTTRRLRCGRWGGRLRRSRRSEGRGRWVAGRVDLTPALTRHPSPTGEGRLTGPSRPAGVVPQLPE